MHCSMRACAVHSTMRLAIATEKGLWPQDLWIGAVEGGGQAGTMQQGTWSMEHGAWIMEMAIVGLSPAKWKERATPTPRKEADSGQNNFI
ncbi:uncharacterized protein Dsimw501_GD26952 [Drosophila simulans]|nr:uncharacterized protein Dsimw501_GD26952 [Drosophila simulans]